MVSSSKAVNAPQQHEGWFANQVRVPQTSTPEDFGALICSDLVQNAKLVKQAGLKPSSRAKICAANIVTKEESCRE